jgi:hypothetical protein
MMVIDAGDETTCQGVERFLLAYEARCRDIIPELPRLHLCQPREQTPLTLR